MLTRDVWNSWDEPPLSKIEVKTSEFNHSPALFLKAFSLTSFNFYMITNLDKRNKVR